jgi:hypothetical protein
VDVVEDRPLRVPHGKQPASCNSGYFGVTQKLGWFMFCAKLLPLCLKD